jgi:hypothetical protein
MAYARLASTKIGSSIPSNTPWRANDFYRALGMASDEFCHAAKQETPDASLPIRTNHDQIGAPLCRGIEDALSYVTYLDRSVGLESGNTQLLRNSLNQRVGWFCVAFQLRSVAWVHLGGSRRNRLQHMQDQDLRTLNPKLRDNDPHDISGDL